MSRAGSIIGCASRRDPVGSSAKLGALVGLCAYVVDGSHRRIASQNVAAAFPARSRRERRRIVRGAFKHFGRLLFELLKFSTLSPEAMLARVEFEGEERVRAAYAHGKGVLFVTGHFGYWELQAMVHALRLPPMAVMARALDNPDLNAAARADADAHRQQRHLPAGDDPPRRCACCRRRRASAC